MNNEEMFLTILNQMDSMETGINGLNGRMDKLGSNMNMEFYAVRTEMDVLNKLLKKSVRLTAKSIDSCLQRMSRDMIK